MLRVILVLLVCLTTSRLSFAKKNILSNEAIELISCYEDSDFKSGVKYSITYEKLNDDLRIFFLNKHESSLKEKVKIPEPKINLYGDTLIVTVDAGRSGFVHIYSNSATNVHMFEVNLKNSEHVNTESALTNYDCYLN